MGFFEVVAAFVNANKTAHGDTNPYKNDQKQQIPSEPTSLIKLILTLFTIVFRETDADPIRVARSPLVASVILCITERAFKGNILSRNKGKG